MKYFIIPLFAISFATFVAYATFKTLPKEELPFATSTLKEVQNNENIASGEKVENAGNTDNQMPLTPKMEVKDTSATNSPKVIIAPPKVINVIPADNNENERIEEDD